MKQVKVNNILYVMDTEAYQITEDTDVDIIYVPEDHYDEYVAAQWGQPGELITGDEVARIQDVLSKMQKYNYNTIRVTIPDYIIEAEKKEKEYSQIVAKYVIETAGDTYIAEVNGSFGQKNFVEIEIDGVKQETITDTYYLTEGEHIIKFVSKYVELIISSAFRYVGGILKEIYIPKYVETIQQSAFQKCSGLTKVTFAENSNLKELKNLVFSECSFATINLPNKLITFGSNCFGANTQLTEINFNDDVKSIPSNCCNGCTSLTTVKIGSGVTSIGDQAFRGTSALTNFYVYAITPPTLYSATFTNSSNNFIIYVPAASVDAYKAATNWSNFASRIQSIPSE